MDVIDLAIEECIAPCVAFICVGLAGLVTINVPKNSFAVVQDTEEVLSEGLHFAPCKKLLTVTWNMPYNGTNRQKKVTYVKIKHRLSNTLRIAVSEKEERVILISIEISVNGKIFNTPQPWQIVNRVFSEWCDTQFSQCKEQFNLNYDVLTLNKNAQALVLKKDFEKLEFVELTGVNMIAKLVPIS